MPTPTLFEYLGIAAQERIHSQALAWLLTPSASPLTPAHRVALLKALGVICTERDVSELLVQTELDSLDLVCASPRIFLVVENKLKSRQSSLQLLGYDAKIEAVAAVFGTTVTAHKVFLTLSQEKSGCGWADIDYADLLKPLAAAAKASKNVYVDDYAMLLARLVGAREKFLGDPGNFLEVHRRISWSAARRLKEQLPTTVPPDESFICTNRLERIFVETLLRNLVAGVPNAVSDAGAHGRPLVQVPLWLVELEDGGWYRAGLQLQGTKLKLNIADVDYESSAPGMKLTMFDELLEGGAGIKRSVHKGTSRDYRSWVWDAPSSLNSLAPPAADFAEVFKTQVDAARVDWKKALTVLKDGRRLISFVRWTPEQAAALAAVKRAARKKSGKVYPLSSSPSLPESTELTGHGGAGA